MTCMPHSKQSGRMMRKSLLMIYALYFVITYRIACSHVPCCGGEKQETEI